MALTKVTNSMISGAAANVLDFGADPTGVADSKTAIDAAIASGGKIVYFPTGTYRYDGQLVLPSGMHLRGAGAFTFTTIIFNYAGFGIRVNGDLGVIQDLFLQFSASGVDFSTASANTTFNTLDRCFLQGPGRGANRASAAHVGVRFQSPTGSPARVSYFNNVTNCYFTGFGTCVDFENGANGNFCDNNNLNNYWYGYYVQSLENRITGGFFNDVAGIDSSNLTDAYYLTSTATRNVIEAAVGEPGSFSRGYVLESGASLNYVNMPSSNFDFGNANLSDGTNYFPGNLIQQKQYINFTENNYYTLKIASLGPLTYQRGVVFLRYTSFNDAINVSASGEASFMVRVNASGTVNVQMLRYTSSSSLAPVFVGVTVDGSDDLYLVFYHRNNGTGDTGGVLTLQLNSYGGIGFTLPADKSAGSLVNPTTVPVLAASSTVDPPSIADGDSHSFTITVTGAAIGYDVSVSASASLSGLVATAYVSATNTVTVVLANLTGSPVDLGSMTFYVYAQPQTIV